MLYQEIDPRAIDKLAKRSRHLTTATEVGNAVGKKRPRRQLQRSQIDVTLSDSGDEASDEADASSDSTEEPDRQQQSGRRPNKRQKLMAHPLKSRKSHKSSKEGGVNARRELTTQIDWSDDWWETQKMPADLVEAIKHCKETKCTRSHTDPCPVLLHISHFGARWSHALKCFYCIDHSRLVPGDGFRSHFGGRLHPMAILGTTRYIFLTASAFHLADCYPEMRNQTYEKLKLSLPVQLPERLPLKEDSDSFQKRYKCPDTTCDAWVAVNKGRGAPVSELRRHVKTHDKILDNDFPPVSPQWTQLVGVGQGYHLNGSTHYFTFPETYRPSTKNAHKPVFSIVDLAAPSTDTWPVLLGWEDYINQIAPKLGSRQKVVEKLRDLVSLPSRRRISVFTGLTKILERGLFISNNLNLSYLEDAATWVSLMHKSFRAHFGHGGCA
jgi:hypothetical protein